MASVKEKLYSRIMEIKDDLILIELGEYEGTASSATKLPLTYDRLTEKYIKNMVIREHLTKVDQLKNLK